MNLKEIYLGWLDNQHTWSKATKRTYRSIISNIDLSSSESLQKSMQQYRKKNSDKTYNLKITVLRSLVRCLNENKIESDIVVIINSLQRLKNVYSVPHKPYSDEEVKILLQNAKGWRHQAIWIALNTGLRKSEIGDLLVSDIDIEKGWIRVRKGKGNKSRNVALLETNVLSRYKKIRELTSGITGDHWLFSNRGSKPYLYSASIFKTLKKKIGFGVSLHRCRATYGTKLYLKTNDVKLVQLQLGHSKSSTTDIYIQISLSEISKRMRQVGRLY